MRTENRAITVGGEAMTTALAAWMISQSISFDAEFFADGIYWVITVPQKYAPMVERRLGQLS